ncbi:hypothetical protein EYZ11_003854 [Aspergillus tanneri]|uniref:Uncharacterized protein n=1 Tax=Aspergillus tanneri TaxID=1220188 RepID=A0A4S3JLZ9_9EURO|nr:uncharacterized protein ATNIH1004_005855 [Aspergillus tanneri]KAA8647166.1 hypothetical protein ATNIH1004_005855 [Aspergillus tanneri]THC96649.1 hypothetical protein EYZ11_003854 [Aspergillus tanneri]
MHPDAVTDHPPVFNYVLSFLLVGVAWGFTTPFIRRAAADFNARQDQSSNPETSESTRLHSTHPSESEYNDDDGDEDNPPPSPSTRPLWMSPSPSISTWLKSKLKTIFSTVVNLLRTPAYAIPLVVNLTGKLSLTVPLANSSAFLFTVLGEWYVERKVIEKETWMGMALVLAGIAICVKSKGT